jgi:ABC-type transport system involved in cytochrome bd biosynthesis fused ATPase/permease subunit
LIIIIGKVGTGKSAFLNGILGEMKLAHGEIYVNGSVGFTSSLDTWIINASFRENILFGKLYDKELYDTVLETCSLIKDV